MAPVDFRILTFKVQQVQEQASSLIAVLTQLSMDEHGVKSARGAAQQVQESIRATQGMLQSVGAPGDPELQAIARNFEEVMGASLMIAEIFEYVDAEGVDIADPGSEALADAATDIRNRAISLLNQEMVEESADVL